MADWKIPLAVAIGGALGAAARHLTAGLVDPWLAAAFPAGTLTVNVLGSFLMGLFIEATALVWSPPPALRAMIAVGVLGAFTTFSAFALETLVLLEEGAPLRALVNVVASVVTCLAACWAGLWIGRSL